VRRFQASLALCEGSTDERPGFPPSDRIRITAMAAANLAERDTARARALFGEALAAADGLDHADPAHRAMAVTANNLACTLEEKTARTPAERALMIVAAQTARRHWAIAGGWLETERAEYRLAMSWLQAGDPASALNHARQCLAIVEQHGGAALERFFAWEAIGQAARAAGDGATHGEALEHARTAFAALDEGGQGWCRASLDKLAG
jgi:Tfp pilus assembly protein PilF